jgi:pyruvate/2-oxoglutarate dehydrogenase complex dihydrolipoamide dehydrogenase (E3) component
MAVDYDLVIVGGSSAGIYAAIVAASLKARVALVASHWQVTEDSDRSVLSQVGRTVNQVRTAAQFGIQVQAARIQPAAVTADWQATLDWTDTVLATLEEVNSPALLASLGIDVIQGNGEFRDRPHLAFVVNDRVLRSRAYLLAPTYRPILPDISGLQSTKYWTPNEWRSIPDRCPSSLVVIGGAPTGIELAQTLARFGSQVTMVFRSQHLLPKEDPEIAFLVQAQLESEGIQVLSQTQVSQVRELAGKKWVQAGDRAIETNEILLATGQYPDLASLNLEAVGVQFAYRHLQLNRRLQTTNRRIYACSHWVHNHPFPHIARYEAQIALKNALFLPRHQASYHALPRTYFTQPEFASVGLTEPQARERFGKAVGVVRQPFQTLTKAQIQAETTGLCKLIIRNNGEILGAHIFGAQASEMIGTIALAIRHRLKIHHLADFTLPSPTLSEILSQTIATWRQQRLKQNNQRQDFLEGLFQLRRSWSS